MNALLDFYAKHSRLVDQIGVNAILALSLSVSLQAGQLALAQAAFMGIAAYVSAILAMNAHWPLVAPVARAAPLDQRNAVHHRPSRTYPHDIFGRVQRGID